VKITRAESPALTVDERVARAKASWNSTMARCQRAEASVASSRWLLTSSRAVLDRRRPLFRGAADRPRLEGITVLVVEDDEPTRYAWSRYLTECGAIVRAVATGKEALRALEEGTPDILVIDLVLPGLNGFQLLEKARSMALQTPALALTAYDVPEHGEHALRQGFSAFLAKPVDPAFLAQEIARHVFGA
jgi:CheY-like chemotaxis protein